jgi:ATP-dependent DNA helicase RecG
LLQKTRAHGLPEPEFVDMEIALRINLYRNSEEKNTSSAANNAGIVPDSTETVPDSATKVPDSARECRINVEQLPEQQATIYRSIAEKGSITSAEVEILLGVKPRRARAVLNEMVDKDIIKKVGAARTTKYMLY